VRALVIEDEQTLREQIVDELREQGFAIDETGDGDEGLYLATEMPVDVAIVDLGLPGTDGIEIIRQARAKQCSYPILILTARTRWQDKVEGLEAGADDYLAKPFHMQELMARLRAILRRSGGWSESVLRFAQNQAQNVLEYLALHDGEVISKAKLLDHLYDEETDRDANILEVFVRRLRNKLDPEKTLLPIETLRGRGYRLALARADAEQPAAE